MRLPIFASVVITGIVSVCAFPALLDDSLTEYVERMKRDADEEIHGYALAAVHAEDPDSGEVRRLTKRDIEYHASHPSTAVRRFSVELHTGERLQLYLNKHSVLTPATSVIERVGEEEGEKVIHKPDTDCFFTGSVKSSEDEFASFSLCHGEVMGSFHSDDKVYEVIPLPEEIAARHRRSADDETLHVLVTWEDLRATRQKRMAVSHDRLTMNGVLEEDDDSNLVNDDMEPTEKYEDDGGTDAEGQTNTTTPMTQYSDGKGVRRNPADKTVVLELGAVMDSFALEEFGRRYKRNDTEFFMKVLAVKWNGIAHAFRNKNLGWNITVALPSMEVWRTNPRGYSSAKETEAEIGSRMRSLCLDYYNPRRINVDVGTVLSSARGFMGLSFVKCACRRGWRCNASRSKSLRFTTEYHEIRHTLGLNHEQMKSAALSRAAYDRLLPNFGCLFSEEFMYNAEEFAKEVAREDQRRG